MDALEEIKRLYNEKLFPIYLYGPTGRGKSFLAARVHIAAPLWPRFESYGDFIEETIQASKGNGYAPWERLRELKGIFTVDEIGVGVPNDWKNEIMWKLLEVRRDKPLLLTGNLTPGELAKHFDARIASRIIAGSLVELDGVDQRSNWLNDKSEVERRFVKIGKKS